MTGKECIEKANINELIGIPYNKLDCQALIEKILMRGGIQCKNFRGSNHMWREMVTNRRDKYTNIIPGTILFTVKLDGGEKKRGYKDSYGNACHVGMYVGNGYEGNVIHSTTGGVQWDDISSNRWNWVADCIYFERTEDTQTDLEQYFSDFIEELEKLISKYKIGGKTNDSE